MAVFVGTLAADNAAQRLAGIEECDQRSQHRDRRKERRCNGQAKARSNVEDVINAYCDLNLVCGLWSYNGPAIARPWKAAARRARSWPRCSTKSMARSTASSRGTIQCTCVQKPFQFGYLSSKWLHDLATRAMPSSFPGNAVDTGVDIINKDNVDEFQKDLAAMKAGT